MLVASTCLVDAVSIDPKIPNVKALHYIHAILDRLREAAEDVMYDDVIDLSNYLS